MLLTDCLAAALRPSYHLTETAFGRDLAVLRSRRGGTDEFLGRGELPRSRAPGNGGVADPWKSVWCSRGLTPLAEPVQRSREGVGSRAVPVVTPGEEEVIAYVHRPYLDKRGHKRVQLRVFRGPPFRLDSGPHSLRWEAVASFSPAGGLNWASLLHSPDLCHQREAEQRRLIIRQRHQVRSHSVDLLLRR